MTNNPNQPNKLMRSGSFIQELTNRFRLIGRLLMDSRVHPAVKILPVASLVYVLWPIDIPGPFDDALILWAGTTLFVELCPPDVVEEHLQSMRPRIVSDQWQGVNPPTGQQQHNDVVEGTYYENDPNRPSDSNR